jgi:hypothetical protein
MRIARYTAFAVAALIFASSSIVNASPVSVIYDPASGNLSLDSPSRSVTTFEAKSAGNLFIPGNVAPGVIAPPFDLITPAKLFKLSAGAGAYNSIDFGNVLPGGLGGDAIAADMSISGSLTPDGSGNNALDAGGLDIVVVPEPSSILLVGFGLMALLGLRRRS